MEFNDSFRTIKDLFNHKEESINVYAYPFPTDTKVKKNEYGGPTHRGAFNGAIDFIVDLETPILASLNGTVVEVIDTHDKFGNSKKYKDDLNYITIQHANGEFTQYAHLAKGSAKVKVGDYVDVGQQIGITGNSGWMTEPHLHFLVFKSESNKNGFKGLKIRFI
jgi:murein DD-endopeptidase MepM/ murein hydrolase activator NlpD